jgi:uncharacterized integral membrane protein
MRKRRITVLLVVVVYAALVAGCVIMMAQAATRATRLPHKARETRPGMLVPLASEEVPQHR